MPLLPPPRSLLRAEGSPGFPALVRTEYAYDYYYMAHFIVYVVPGIAGVRMQGLSSGHSEGVSVS